MAIQDTNDDRTSCFLTDINTSAVHETTNHQEVDITVAQKGLWASTDGMATIVQDSQRKQNFWSKTTEAFFSDSKPEDRDIV